ncbi:MAG: TIGR02147 family protein [Pseudobdellovibrionaceae bacterium]
MNREDLLSKEKTNKNGDALSILKSIFEYSDYRSYLSDYFRQAKSSNRHFSYRVFSRNCGFKSPNFLMLVMNGKSRLTSVSVEKVIKGIKLNKEEGKFFRNMVAFNEAKTSDIKRQHAKEMLLSRTFKELHPLSEGQLEYLATWYFPVIRSVIGLESCPQDPEWIASHIRPQLKEDEVKTALTTLESLGLLIKNEKGEYQQASSMVSTPSEVLSIFAAQYHQQMLDRAKESIDRFKREQRHLAGMTVALNQESLDDVKKLVEKFRSEVMTLASRSAGTKDIYQVNLQVFPLFLGDLKTDKAEKK